MCIEESVLPDFLRSGLQCLVINQFDNESDVATYNSNGYLYEVINKQIVGHIFINEETISSLSVFYLYENDIEVKYYVLFTINNKILIVKKTNGALQITAQYYEVKQFTVYDFNGLGYPQIQIYSFQSPGSEILEFSDTKNLSEVIPGNSSSQFGLSLCNLAKSMTEKLQMVNMSIDELLDEHIQIIKNIVSDKKTSPYFYRFSFLGILKFSSKFSKKLRPEIKLVNKQYKNFRTYWSWEMRITNCSESFISDLQLLMHHKKIKKFTYCSFPISISDDYPDPIPANIEPGQDILLVGVLQIPNFIFEKDISIECLINASEFDNYLKISEAHINAFTAITRREHELAVYDVPIIITALLEINLVVSIESDKINSLEYILINSMPFEKWEFSKKHSFFYSDSREIYLKLEFISNYPQIRHLSIYARDYSQVYILINALYDVLPEKTTILLCKHKNNS